MFQKINEQQARITQLESSLAKSIAGEEQRAVNEVKLAKRVKVFQQGGCAPPVGRPPVGEGSKASGYTGPCSITYYLVVPDNTCFGMLPG